MSSTDMTTVPATTTEPATTTTLPFDVAIPTQLNIMKNTTLGFHISALICGLLFTALFGYLTVKQYKLKKWSLVTVIFFVFVLCCGSSLLSTIYSAFRK